MVSPPRHTRKFIGNDFLTSYFGQPRALSDYLRLSFSSSIVIWGKNVKMKALLFLRCRQFILFRLFN